ncbi:MAG: gliding motility-associated C-terminal domain-containing protein [Bacteroidales bacterium]|nr:gliding motility-associated C-terminal domain-containing protein [Bacteroidales bacterium]MCK9499541.1 gliding motility-associated C-terminal domain-containing protein [Bacteroidales bacterium]
MKLKNYIFIFNFGKMPVFNKIKVILFLFLFILGNLNAQTLLNNGGFIQSNSGSYVYVNGSVENNSTGNISVNQTAGVPAEVYVTGDITNNANLIVNGHIRLLGNWYNNSVFTSTSGTVFFEGGNQLLSGSVSSSFYNLTLDGTGLKTQSIDQFSYGILDLKHLELQTETNVFYVENNDVNAIIRTSGFVSSLNGGKLSRKTNQSLSYLFPVGSSLGNMRYRPVSVKPTSATANEYAVRLANLDANLEGYNRNNKEYEICNLNELFYHQIARTNGASNADIFISYDYSADGDWDGIANWKSANSEWQIVNSSYTTATSPYYQAIKTNLDDFNNEEFILYKSIILPSFTQIGPLCQNHAAPSLPSISLEGISGTWSPATISTTNIGSTTYVFTPNAGQDCWIEYSMTIDVEDCCAMSLNTIVSQPVCYGESGHISISQTGGTNPVTYTVNSNPIVSTSFQAEAGTYTIVGTDAYSCTASVSVTINNPQELQMYLSSTPAQCGASGGSAVASVIGGTPNYNFVWSPGGQTINNITNQAPGRYSVTVYDNNMCSAHGEINIEVEGSISAEINTIQEISCYGMSDAVLEANSQNGVNPLTYLWDNGNTTKIITNLGANSYVVTVTDAWSCKGIAYATLLEPSEILINPTINNVTCFGDTNGSISVSISGGTAPFTYNWSNGLNSSSINNLPANEYYLQVYDASACSSEANFTISQPNILKLNKEFKNISCYGYNDGSANLSATGGTSPYNFNISDGVNTMGGNSFYNLSAGTYTIKVNDSNNCVDSSKLLLLEPAKLTATYFYTNPSCIGNNNGYIEINPSGGTEPYSFIWENNVSDLPTISGLAQGIYNITIADNNDCEFELPFVNLIDVDEECLKIPNAFTPNGDGINETWIIENIEMFPTAIISVYNRWGQKLFEGKGDGEEWDGKFNGKLVPTGSYLYVIEMYKRGKNYTGVVTVVY